MCLLGRLFKRYPWAKTFSSIMGQVLKSKHHGEPLSYCHLCFWIAEISVSLNTQFAFINRSQVFESALQTQLFRYLSLPLLIHVVFYLHFICTVKCYYVGAQNHWLLLFLFDLALTKQPFPEQRNTDLESSSPLPKLHLKN